MRTEKDSLGKKKVTSNALYGIQSSRAMDNFRISGRTLDASLFSAIAEIKIAAAQTNLQLKLLDSKKANVITKAAKEIVIGKHDDNFVVDQYQAGAGTSTHMNINELIANRALELLGKRKGSYKIIHPNDHVNMGQSTNDVFPSAIRIVSYRKLNLLIQTLKKLQKSFLMKGNEFKRIIKSGRTHLKDAVPITLGQEFHAHSTALEKNIKLLKSSQNDLLNLNLGSTAIGTGINTQKGYKKKIVTNLKKITKIPWKIPKDPIYESQYVSSFVEVSNNLSLLTIDLTKIANDLRLLDSGPTTGLHEIILPPVQPGSSIMPGKVNPSIPEMLNMVCYQVMGNTEAIKMAGQAGQLELNVMTPLIAKDLIESLDILNNSLIQFDNKCIKGIKANKETCKRYFEYSQGLATLLNPIIGYEKAAQVVKESTRTGKPITEIILKKGILTKKELSKMLDVSKITKKN